MKKVAIVTGASRGIGRAVAKRLAQDGFVVVVNYLGNAGEADQVVAELKGIGGNGYGWLLGAFRSAFGSPATPSSRSASQYHGSRSSYEIGQSTPTPNRDRNLKSSGTNRSAVPSQCHVVPPTWRKYVPPNLSFPSCRK